MPGDRNAKRGRRDGKQGLRELAEQNLAKAAYLRSALVAAGATTEFDGAPRFHEFVLTSKESAEKLNAKLLGKQILQILGAQGRPHPRTRFGGIERAIKDALTSGAIGKPNFIRARLSHGGPQLWAPGQKWFTTASEAGGGAMLDLGVHVADLAIWFMGEIDSVSGQVGTLAKQIEVDDTGVMVLHFKSGAIGVVEASWSSMPPLSAIEIYGSEGRVMAGYPRNDISILKADGSPAPGFSREDVMSRFDPRDLLAPSRALADNFVGAIQGRVKPSPDGIDGLRAVEAIEACYRSSRSGARIVLPLDS